MVVDMVVEKVVVVVVDRRDRSKRRNEERVVRERRDIRVRVNVDKIGGISVRSPIANADKNERVDGDNISAFKLAGEFAANDTAKGVAIDGDNITLIAAE